MFHTLNLFFALQASYHGPWMGALPFGDGVVFSRREVDVADAKSDKSPAVSGGGVCGGLTDHALFVAESFGG
jgi:hypothetical protein